MNFKSVFTSAALTALTIVGGYTGYWFYAKAQAAAYIEEWISKQRAAGVEIAHDPITIDGYPFLLRAHFTNLKIARLAQSQFYRTSRLQLEVNPWRFDRIRFLPLDQQEIQIGSSDAQMQYVVSQSNAVAVAAFRPNGELDKFRFTANGLQIADKQTNATLNIGELQADAETPANNPATHQDLAGRISIRSNNVELPSSATTKILPFGPTVSQIELTARLKGRFGSGKDAIEAWRKDGGTVEFDHLYIDWREFTLRASGTLALDETSRPLGAFTADIQGFAEIMNALIDQQVIAEGPGKLALAGMSLLSKPAKNGKGPVLTLPVTAQNGQFYAGPVKLFDLAPIRFPVQSP